jgi:hypothetical protein
MFWGAITHLVRDILSRKRPEISLKNGRHRSYIRPREVEGPSPARAFWNIVNVI